MKLTNDDCKMTYVTRKNNYANPSDFSVYYSLHL